MLFLGLSLVVIILCFGLVLVWGPPYLPTLSKQVTIALDLMELETGETLLELGCGDGKVLVAAAKRGYKAVGYELNPLLVLLCKLRTYRYRSTVQVHWGNFLTRPWPACAGIFVFGLQRIMPALDKKIMQSLADSVNSASLNNPSVQVVSFAFTFPNRQPVRQVAGVSLYRFEVRPARHLES